MKLKVQLEGENEEMFQLLNDVEGKIQQVAEEAIRKQEKKWKEAMSEVISNSKLEIRGAHDQLIVMRQEADGLRAANEALKQAVEAAEAEKKEQAKEVEGLKEEIL